MEPKYVADNFIPVALDTYFRGTPQDLEFCGGIRAGGNHCAAGTAGGRLLGSGAHLKLRERELSKVLEEYRKLPEEERKPKLPPPLDPATAKRQLPKPPPNGLIVRGYCTYIKRDAEGKAKRSQEFYYRQNPDRWPAETQSDLLWLTEGEWKSLLPASPKPGEKMEVAAPIQRRIFSTMAIDYMEGSVNALKPRETMLTLTVEKVEGSRLTLRLDGHGKLGREMDDAARKEKNSRGSEIRLVGYVGYDGAKIDRFDVVGLGTAWGNKMEYVGREVKLDDYPWTYGIAMELVETRRPMDLIPPYNMLHYGSGLKYFE